MSSARPGRYVFTQDGPIRIWSTVELLELPPPTWLVDSIMPYGGLVGLYGPPGCGKSFLAIDFAMCVATGIPWNGNPVKPGFVVYVSAEGGTGIGKRVMAWLTDKNISPYDANIGWITESIPVTADNEQMEQLMQRISHELREVPVLIVIDTLARCFDGDENETQDMGRFIQGCDLLRTEYKCTVMVVHHTRLGGDRERGNTSFRGATDAMIAVDKVDDMVTMTCTRQKDYEDFKPVELQLRRVAGTESCVVGEFDQQQQRSEKIDLLLEVLAEHGPLTYDQWRDKVVEIHGDKETKTFYKLFPVVRKRGMVEKKGRMWRTTTSSSKDKGRAQPTR